MGDKGKTTHVTESKEDGYIQQREHIYLLGRDFFLTHPITTSYGDSFYASVDIRNLVQCLVK